MSVEQQYLADVDAILAHRHDNGADLWATEDKRLLKGSPFSTFDSVLYLLELGRNKLFCVNTIIICIRRRI